MAHRLDRETSGVVLLAKSKEAAQRLEVAFRERRVEKTYLAVLRGAMEMCRYEHAGFPADATEFVSRMTTTVAGKGPYVLKIPALKTGVNAGATGN